MNEVVEQSDFLQSDEDFIANPDKLDQDWKAILKPKKTFGIAISGDVHLNETEVKIVDTVAFQRLRKIKQLGTTFLVYPSANHTRFEHSLGTLKYTDLLIKKVREIRHSETYEKCITQEEEFIIRLMALTHDICHIPFGHTFEDEFGIFKRHDINPARWNYFVGDKSEIGKIIKNATKNIDDKKKLSSFYSISVYERYLRLVKCDKNFDGFLNDAFMYDMVSNTVCADLLDYLERDSFMTKLDFKYHPRFLDYFFVHNTNPPRCYVDDHAAYYSELHSSKNTRHLAIRAYNKEKKGQIRTDILEELIQLLRYRYCLSERVYYHHAKINAGSIITNAVHRSLKQGLFCTEPFADEEIYDLFNWGDDELVVQLKHVCSERLKTDPDNLELNAIGRLLTSFENRCLYEEVANWNKDQLVIKDKFDVEYFQSDKNDPQKASSNIAKRLNAEIMGSNGQDTRLKLEDILAEALQVQKGDVLFYIPSFNMSMKIAKVLIQRNKESLFELRAFPKELLSDECEHILKTHRNLWIFKVFLNSEYATEENKTRYHHYINIIHNFLKMTMLYDSDEEQEIHERNYFSLLLPSIKEEINKTENSQKIFNMELVNNDERIYDVWRAAALNRGDEDKYSRFSRSSMLSALKKTTKWI